MLSQKMEKRRLDRGDMDAINLPEELWRAKTSEVDPSVRELVSTYLEKLPLALSKGYGLLVLGKPGVGKSSIAALVAKEATAYGCEVYFTSLYELRDDIRAHRTFGDDLGVLERCRNADALVIDNLIPDDSKWSQFPLIDTLRLIQSRASRHKLTVATALLDGPVMEDRYEVRDMTLTAMTPIQVGGPNRRIQLAESAVQQMWGK